MIKKIRLYVFITILSLFVLLGIGVRLVEVANGNYVFGFDQGLDFMAARSIAIDHKLTLIGSEAGAGFAGLPGIFHGPGYHYILAVLLLISSGNPYGSMVFLCGLSLVVLWSLFALSKRIFGSATAFVVLLLTAVSMPIAAQARMIWAPNFSAVVALPFLWALWWSRKKTAAAIGTTTLLATLLYHFELPMAVPAIVASFLYFWFILKIRDIRIWLAAIGGVIVGFLPMILFESRHGWRVVSGILSYGSRVHLLSPQVGFSPIKEFVGDGNAILSTVKESFLFPMSLVRNIFPWILFIGLFLFVRTEHKKAVQQYVYALLILIGAHLLVFYPYRGPVYAHYLTLLYVVYPMLASYVSMRLLKVRSTQWLVYVLGIFLAVGVFGRIPKTIYVDFYDYGGTAKIKGKIDAIDSIYTQAAGTWFNISVFTPPVVPYAYDYLMLWYASTRYGYVPGRETRGTVYLLIEPDPEKPWSYNGWLETVIKRGDRIASWKLPSGFIVEKRFIKEDK